MTARRWWRALHARFAPPPIPEPRWRRGLRMCALAARLDPARAAALRELVTWFLHRKRYNAPAGALPGPDWELVIAMQACLPALRQGVDGLRGWREIIVYPGEFRVRHSHHDEATGVVSERDEVLVGEAWERGPLVLSLASVQMDIQQPWDGYNVVIHEMAHKLDMLDGPPDGVPPLRGIARRRWISTFQRAYDGLVQTLDAGGETEIDPYAAENAGEYFAVVSELHFSRPALLRRAEPGVAALLEEFFGPSPAAGME